MTRDQLSKVCGGTPTAPDAILKSHCAKLDGALSGFESMPNARNQATDIRDAMTSLHCWQRLGAQAQTKAQ